MVEVSLLEPVVGLVPVSGKDVAMLEGLMLNVLELNFVVVVTGVVAAEAVLDVVVTGVVTITALELLGTDVGTLVVDIVVVVVVLVVVVVVGVGVVVVVVVVAVGVVVVVNCKPRKTSRICYFGQRNLQHCSL